MATHKLLVHSARQIVQVVADGQQVREGRLMQTLDILQGNDATGYSILVDRNGCICDIGTDTEVKERNPNMSPETRVDAKGKCIIPGLVDAHTHPVWAGDRVHEFAMKLAGATYMEVHKAGGGIHYTVEHTRKASEEELFTSLKDRLETMQRSGTTLVECKSGYGLETETEMKMLKVIERARRSMPIAISSTFLGAHAVPRGKSAEEATTDVLEAQLPELGRLMANGTLHIDNVDVFCEKGVFDLEQSRAIIEKGKRMGMQINFHGDELHPMESAEMGAKMGSLAISHLEEISDSGIDAMAKYGSVGVVLPTTAYILRLTPPPVRKMIERDMAVALGSDFNPNAYCMSMPIVMHLACVILHMSMPEALNAATINAAHALGRSDKHGSLEVGKYGNMVLLNSERWENLIYKLGCANDVIESVIFEGAIVHSKTCSTKRP